MQNMTKKPNVEKRKRPDAQGHSSRFQRCLRREKAANARNLLHHKTVKQPKNGEQSAKMV
ncbi:hypothetical protein GT94_10355 [Geobacillus stearothermophilus]|nr:hypothetical protein ET31_03790 [Geobacillus stearothermophilus]KFX33858.1 hypothetical protein GT94_10355 [Geobacillus stearothermophilus]